MPIDPELLYRQLGQLVAETPAGLAGPGPITNDMLLWLGRCAALVEETGDMIDTAQFRVLSDRLIGVLREQNAHGIISILHRSLARAELKAPAAAQGAFIPVGASFTAFQAITKVVSEAKGDVLIVDPYMNATVLTDFAPLAAERVAIRLLTDSHYTERETMQPAAARWKQQFGTARPLEVRFTGPRQLHDRMIAIDGARVWSLTQSLKDFVARSPATVLRVEGDAAKMKIEAYAQMWADAHPL